MSRKYNVTLKFADRGNDVVVQIHEGPRLVLDYHNSDVEPVRVRAPLPDVGQLLKSIQDRVDRGFHDSIEDGLLVSLESRRREVFDQVQEIRKSVKRLVMTMRGIRSVSRAIKEHAKTS